AGSSGGVYQRSPPGIWGRVDLPRRADRPIDVLPSPPPPPRSDDKIGSASRPPGKCWWRLSTITARHMGSSRSAASCRSPHRRTTVTAPATSIRRQDRERVATSREVLVAFINDHRQAYGVESICRVVPIAPSTYYRHRARHLDPTK